MSMLDAQRSRWSPPPYGAHKIMHENSQAQDARVKETTYRTMAAKPNYFSNRPNRSNRRERCTLHAQAESHRRTLCVCACVRAFSTFILLFIYFVRLHSDRNLMIYLKTRTPSKWNIFRVSPPRIIPNHWTLLCVAALERNNTPNKAFMPNEIFRLTLCAVGMLIENE